MVGAALRSAVGRSGCTCPVGGPVHRESVIGAGHDDRIALTAGARGLPRAVVAVAQRRPLVEGHTGPSQRSILRSRRALFLACNKVKLFVRERLHESCRNHGGRPPPPSSSGGGAGWEIGGRRDGSGGGDGEETHLYEFSPKNHGAFPHRQMFHFVTAYPFRRNQRAGRRPPFRRERNVPIVSPRIRKTAAGRARIKRIERYGAWRGWRDGAEEGEVGVHIENPERVLLDANEKLRNIIRVRGHDHGLRRSVLVGTYGWRRGYAGEKFGQKKLEDERLREKFGAGDFRHSHRENRIAMQEGLRFPYEPPLHDVMGTMDTNYTMQ